MSLFPCTLSFPEENAENLHNLFTMKIFKKKKKKKASFLPPCALQFPLSFAIFTPRFSIPLLYPSPVALGCFCSLLSVSHAMAPEPVEKKLHAGLTPFLSMSPKGFHKYSTFSGRHLLQSSGVSLSTDLWQTPFPRPSLILLIL